MHHLASTCSSRNVTSSLLSTFLQLSASDKDSDQRLQFSLESVTNGGKRKFAVDPTTGRVDVVAPVNAGERFSLMVTATDAGGLSSKVSVLNSCGIRYCSHASPHLNPSISSASPVKAK
jgi:hypothetical protein